MADNSFAWAAARGLTRVNEVHGVEEAKLVLEETFSSSNEKGSRTEVSGAGHVEDHHLTNCLNARFPIPVDQPKAI